MIRSEAKNILPKTLFYIISASAGIFLSEKLKTDFSLTIPLVVIFMEIFAVLIITAIFWFVIYEKFKPNKRTSLVTMTILLILFSIISIGFFAFVNSRLVTIKSNGIVNTYFVGFHDKSGRELTCDSLHVEVLKSNGLNTTEAYADIRKAQNFLFLLSLLYILISMSLFCVTLQYSGIEIEGYLHKNNQTE